jgi:hypothetical protein
VKKYIFVADLFVDEYVGGAELTTHAIMLSTKEKEINRVRCQDLTTEIISNNLDSHWIICNFASLKPEHKLTFAKLAKYSIVEYDYKFCFFRSPELHKLTTNSECDCVEKQESKINLVFYGRADKLWFMSEKQRDIFFKNVKTIKQEKTSVLSSIFSDGDLRFMKSLKDNEKNNKYIILKSDSWIKGTNECIEFAKQNDLEFELVSGLDYHELLIKMSLSKGLIFRPLGSDTCPRIVIEAKLLGCDLKLNDFVQHKDEDWFAGSIEDCHNYLSSRTKIFWDYYER